MTAFFKRRGDRETSPYALGKGSFFIYQHGALNSVREDRLYSYSLILFSTLKNNERNIYAHRAEACNLYLAEKEGHES